MNDSQNPKNNFEEKPITAFRNLIADVENMILGIAGAICTIFFSFILLKTNIIASLGMLFFTAMCIIEIIRGKISLNNKTLIQQNSASPTQELQNKMRVNDEKLKKYKKLKTIFLILGIVIIIGGFIVMGYIKG